jgi:hypothetical protein
MVESLPSWFQADNVFSYGGRWYFGSKGGLHVGPYADKPSAKSKSSEVASCLRQVTSDGQRLRYVRRLLHDEWDQVLIGIISNDESLCVERIDVLPPPPLVRRGEQSKSWFRSNRFFKVDDVWFFSTREGIDVGPFSNEDEAKKHESRLLSLLAQTETDEEAHLAIYEYKHRPTAA